MSLLQVTKAQTAAEGLASGLVLAALPAVRL